MAFQPTSVKRPLSFPPIDPRILVVVALIFAVVAAIMVVLSRGSSAPTTILEPDPVFAQPQVEVTAPQQEIVLTEPEPQPEKIVLEEPVRETAPVAQPEEVVVEWKVLANPAVVPPRGSTEHFTGSITDSVVPGFGSSAGGGIPERVAVIQSAFPERDMRLDTIAIYRDPANENLLIAVDNQGTLFTNGITNTPVKITDTPRIIISDDNGKTWTHLFTPERDGGSRIIGEVRRSGDKFFFSFNSNVWWTN